MPMTMNVVQPNVGQGLRALVVDDSAVSRLLASRALRSLGFSVGVADSGPNALHHLELDIFDFDVPNVAVVDWNIPMGGLQFVTEVRKSECFDNMRIMMVTSEPCPKRTEAALDAGADGSC